MGGSLMSNGYSDGTIKKICIVAIIAMLAYLFFFQEPPVNSGNEKSQTINVNILNFGPVDNSISQDDGDMPYEDFDSGMKEASCTRGAK